MAKKRRKKSKIESSAPVTDSFRAYDAARSTPQRRARRGSESWDAAAESGLDAVRALAEYLDQNHDTASAVLDYIVANLVASGIVTVPKPLDDAGNVLETLQTDIQRLWNRWRRRVDVTGELHLYHAQRLACRATYGSGEVFVQHVMGRGAYPFGPDEVPYRIELLESHHCPMHLTGEGWTQGIQHDQWRRPQSYAFYRQHPGDINIGRGQFRTEDYNVVPAELVTHVKNVKRWPATRGVSCLATVATALWEIKDLKESERIKNRNLSKWVCGIERNPDVPGDERSDDQRRRYHDVYDGMMIELATGDRIVGVGPEYPVQGMPDYIADEHRRVAAGAMVRASSIMRRYDSSYSAARQELVEAEQYDGMRFDYFCQSFCREIYERWLTVAILDGKLDVPAGSEFDLIANAEFRAPPQGWIDPLKEAEAAKLRVDERFQTREQIQIEYGMDEDEIGSEPEPEPTQPVAEPEQAELFAIEGGAA